MDSGVRRGMILRQPWARLVAEGVFPVLVRSMPIKIRGRVAIIAKGIDPLVLVGGLPPNERDFPHPALIGYVRLTGCFEVPRKDVEGILRRKFGSAFARFYPRHHLPKRETAYIWILADPQILKQPRKLQPFRSRLWRRL